MPKLTIENIQIFFEEQDQQAADLVRNAVQKTIPILVDEWGLETPSECRVYLMTSWRQFTFQAPPLKWKVYSALTLPLWASRAKVTWRHAGGWTQTYGKRRAIGVKPPRLIKKVKTSLLGHIFINESPEEMVQRIVCHELTHAFSEGLRLPGWLNEGLAMLSQDRYFGHQTVRQDSLNALTKFSQGIRLPERLPINEPDQVVYHYALGYWLARYLDEEHPEELKDMLSEPRFHEVLEDQAAELCGIPPEDFWKRIDEFLSAHYSGR